MLVLPGCHVIVDTTTCEQTRSKVHELQPIGKSTSAWQLSLPRMGNKIEYKQRQDNEANNYQGQKL